jgi:long-chain fatty acid transport protein
MRTLCRFVAAAALAAVVTVSLPEGAARASGGFQIDEQSAAGVGMAGAQTAIADDPSAIYYNPAGLGFQPGFGALIGGNLIIARTHVSPDALTLWHTAFAPTVFIAQRIGSHVAFGVGLFSNFGEHFEYSPVWRGRLAGYMIDITTATVQPTLALRPLSWLSIGVGLDVVPASLELFRGLNFGGGEGNVHVGASAVGIGGNFGLLLELVPHRLNFGFSYRSRVDLDYTGHGSISAPAELRAMTGGLQTASVTLPLPHNFSVATGVFVGHLSLDAELKVSIWRDLSTLQLTLTDPAAPAGTMPTVDALVLNFHNTWAIRAGGQYAFSRDRVRVRLGAGYDTSPVPTSTLGPLAPDTNRVLVSGGIGVFYRWVTVDLGYMAVFLLKTTSTNPELIATYQSFGQVISLSATVRLERVLQHAAP